MGGEKGKEWKKGPWTHEEDRLLSEYINLHGEGRWSSVAKFTGLNRSGKSCRLRWVNYLRPGLKKGQLTPLEEATVIELHAILCNKWSTIAKYLPGRTDNEIKNYWRTHFGRREKSKMKKTNKQEWRKAKAQKQLEQQPREDEITKNNNNNETKWSSWDAQENNVVHQLQDKPTMTDHQQLVSTWQEDDDGSIWLNLWDLDELPQGFGDFN